MNNTTEYTDWTNGQGRHYCHYLADAEIWLYTERINYLQKWWAETLNTFCLAFSRKYIFFFQGIYLESFSLPKFMVLNVLFKSFLAILKTADIEIYPRTITLTMCCFFVLGLRVYTCVRLCVWGGHLWA